MVFTFKIKVFFLISHSDLNNKISVKTENGPSLTDFDVIQSKMCSRLRNCHSQSEQAHGKMGVVLWRTSAGGLCDCWKDLSGELVCYMGVTTTTS